MIAIIDYGMGNLRSVQKAVEYCKQEVIITNNVDEIKNASHIILPGVGAFKDGMNNLISLGLVDILNQEVLHQKKPFLGICLGMQLICNKSYELGETKGLGWIDAEVNKFKSTMLKVPHVGWNEVHARKYSNLFAGIENGSDFYFVHSFYVDINENMVATTPYIRDFTSALEKANIFACQFHPEKSQHVGLKLLDNFLNMPSQVDA